MKTIIRNEVLLSDIPAIKDDKGNRITYKKLAEKADTIQHYIEERSLIFILCDHEMETVEFIYMAIYLNRIPLLLGSDIDKEMLDNLIKIYKPQYIYCSRAREIARDYSRGMELKNHVLLRTGEKRYEIHSDVALLLSTSGTTGSAKLVKLSYGNLYDNAEQVCLHLGIQSGQKGITPLPLNYAYGISFCVQHWHCGATVLITEELAISQKFCDFYTREKANNFAATPYTYHMLQKIKFWDQEKIEFLHCAMSAGAQMSEEEQQKLATVMKDKFWNMFGMTECTGVVLGTAGNNRPGSVGKAFGNIEATAECETNELIIKSKSVCMGYASHRRQLANGDENQGILHTGDIISIDDEGYIYLKGRQKRYVKILGKRISLDDIENYLNNKFPNIEFACIGTDNRVFIFHNEKESILNKEILILLDRSMKIPPQFISIIFLKNIPRNTTGKVDYRGLEELKNVRKK